jgi:glutamine amidotransferase
MAVCELLGMSSNLSATLNLSLAQLAEHGGPPALIQDGWGVGYYEGADVRLIKDADSADDSDWVRFIRDHDLRSQIVVAHIRRATMGERAYRNAQPFVRELAGRMHLFAHNGWLPGIFDSPGFRSERYFPVGETDSEQAFCALLGRMSEMWRRPGELPPIGDRISVVSSFARDLKSLGPANFLYSDGDVLFAHGDRRKQSRSAKIEPPGLVYLQRRCQRGEHGFVASGVSVEGADQIMTLVASVPLTDDPWQAFAEGEVMAFSKGRAFSNP